MFQMRICGRLSQKRVRQRPCRRWVMGSPHRGANRQRKRGVTGDPALLSGFSPASRLLRVIGGLGEQVFGALANLVLGQFLYVGGEEPDMSEWILQRPGAVAVELILGF